jgi:hypothetical protein
MHQTGLGAHRTPACLAFTDYMNRFIAGDGAPSFPEGAEMLARVDPALDGPVILFQDVIEESTITPSQSKIAPSFIGLSENIAPAI